MRTKTITDTQTMRWIERVGSEPVTVYYRTINMGNGSEEEQEEGAIQGHFTGDTDTLGRTLRYTVRSDKGVLHYLYIDEIVEIEEGYELPTAAKQVETVQVPASTLARLEGLLDYLIQFAVLQFAARVFRETDSGRYL